MQIESVNNNLIKSAAALERKKFRDESGQFLAEGIRLVADAFLLTPDLVERIFITEECRGQVREFIFANPARFSGNFYHELSEKFVFIGKNVAKKLSLADSSQEIIAVLRKKDEREPKDFVLYLDRVRDPSNLGSIIRTACAAGFGLILDNCVDIYSPKVVQSSMSALLSTDFCSGSIETLKKLKSGNYAIFSADFGGENLFSLPKYPRICLVIGNEANGIDPKILAISDKIVTIPMQKTESLNAAVSAGIIMYHFKQFNEI